MAVPLPSKAGEEEWEEDGSLTWRDCGREYLRSTSTHGLRRVGWSRQTAAKLLWAALFVVALSGYLAMMILLLLDYLDYPTRTMVSTELAHQDFPGVTVCSLNPVKLSNIADDFTKPFNKFTRSSQYNGTNFGAIDPYLSDRNFFARQVGLLNAVEERFPFGNDRRDVFLHCSWEGRECDLDQDFIHLWSDKYGDCYTFGGGNHSIIRQQRRRSSTPGPLYGLSLILNTRPEDHLKAMTESSGMRVLVHPAGDMPFPEEGGLSLPPGREASVAITPELHKHLGSPYGDCRQAHQNAYGYDYSATACQKVCVQEMLLQSCLCGDPMLPLSRGQSICSLNDMYTREYACAERIKAELKDGKRRCDCPPPCRETRYALDYSLAGWPNPSHVPFLDASLKPIAGVDSYPKRDLVAAKLFFRESGRRVFAEEATFELADYLSYLGGLSALFIGVSLLTVVEFVELCWTALSLLWVDYGEWPVDAAERRRRTRPYQRPSTAASHGRCSTAATVKEVKPRLNTPDATLNARPLPPRLSNNTSIVSS